MKAQRKLSLLLTLAISLGAASSSRGENVLLASWNFNDGGALETANHGVFVSEAGLDLSDLDPAAVANFAGSSLNAVDGDPSGGSLVPQGGNELVNNGKSATFNFPTTGFDKIELSYATRGTSTGFTSQVWLWSTDNVTFNEFQTETGTTTTSFNVRTIDFSNVTALDNQADVWIRVTFDGASSAAGNNRLDNVQFNSVPEPSTYAAIFGALALAAVVIRRRFVRK